MRIKRVTLIFFFLIACQLQISYLSAQDLNGVQLAQNPILSKLDKAQLKATYEEEDYWVWGSSVVKGDDNKYHMFVSRFPKTLPFHPGWMVASEIVHAVSDVPEGPYVYSDVALDARGSQFWDGRSIHNPRILKSQGKYYLIYMGSTHPFEEPKYDELTLDSKWCIVARNNKRIGLAVADSPYGPWERMDKPILDVEANTFYSYLTSNPSPLMQEDGSVLMLFKGRAYTDNFNYSDMSVGVAYAPEINGPYTVLNDKKPIVSFDAQGEIEDPFFWRDNDKYYMIFKDHVAKFTGERGAGVMAQSVDALNWSVEENPKAYSKTIEWEDLTVTTQGQLERPFILFDENNRPAYLFFATMDGIGGFFNATKSWNMVIPFK